MRKKLVSCLWFGSHFNPEELTLRSGEDVEVHSPGWWNGEDEPTFLRAELETEKLDPKRPVDINCFVNISDVPEDREGDVIVVFFDDDPDRQFSDPVIVLEDACDENIKDLFFLGD